MNVQVQLVDGERAAVITLGQILEDYAGHDTLLI
jgi:hypothetical protein